MTTAHKAHHHQPRPKRWDESWHVAIGCSITILLIFGLIFGIGIYVPQTPIDPVALSRLGLDHQSLQERRQ